MTVDISRTMEQSLARLDREGGSLPDVAEIDDFTPVLERRGHLAGNEVLHRVGYAVAATVRDTDIAAHYDRGTFAPLGDEVRTRFGFLTEGDPALHQARVLGKNRVV